MTSDRTLTHDQARAFYDRFGAKQDWQRFYEDPAVRVLLREGGFESATSVVEFGCGTGRLAERLLQDYLPPAATYLAADVSATMVGLAERRLAPFGNRARVVRTTGESRLDEPETSSDRFIATYVLDLLSEDDIAAVLAEAHRLLRPGGRVGLVSLTHGATAAARLIERMWVAVHRAHPSWVGGCRPVALRAFLDDRWRVAHQEVVTSLAMSSEVVVAERMSARGT